MAKQGFLARIDVGLLERARNAVWHLGRGLTLTAVFETALEAWVTEQEKAHNKGRPFPQREGELPYSPKKGQ